MVPFSFAALGAAALPVAGMVSSVSRVADGAAGVAEILATLDRLKTHYGRLPAIRAAALLICGPMGNHDQAAQLCALAGFVRSAVTYVADPVNAEFIQTPDVLLLAIHARGRVSGDCDDHCLLFAALCESIGIPATIVGVAAAGAQLADHVIVVVETEAGPLDFDLCAKGFSQPFYADKIFPT